MLESFYFVGLYQPSLYLQISVTMEKKSYDRMKSKNGSKKRNTYEDLRRSTHEEPCEFLPVAQNNIGFIIGTKGRTINQIQEVSGAEIRHQFDSGRDGFTIRGNERQRARAKELIREKLETLSKNQSYPGRSIVIPNQFKKLVNGPSGDHIRHVSTTTGAEVSSIGADHRLYVKGPTRYTKHAEYLIKSKMAAGRVMANTICVYIDEKNLPEDCELKLVPVDEKERLILPVGSSPQYRLKPCEEYDMEVQGADSPYQAVADYDASISQRVLTALRNLKREIISGNYHKADLWCHFGKVVIREPDEADLEETWSIVDSIKKLQATKQKRSEWLVAFKEGVDLTDKGVNDAFGEQIIEDFMARYDFTFLSPSSQTMRCKVWVANKDVGKKLEEVPIPFHDLKNVVEELRFEDEPTRARCRGWLVLQSKKIIQVNIIFPGSDIDCRITLRALMDDLVANSNLVCKKEETRLLSKYLSKLTFTDADGVRLPADEKLPKGFNHTHWRCSRRTLFTPRPGFSMIVSNERSWCSDLKNEENRVTTDIHLHCEKWDQLLSEEDWEPEIICAELPEFLHFVRQVQDFISSNCTKTADQE